MSRTILFGALLLFAFLPHCTKKSAEEANAPKTAYFPVRKGEITGKNSWRGVVRSANRIEIRTDRKIRIAKLHVRNYDTVRRGQLLIDVDNSEQQQRAAEIQEKMRGLELEQNAAEVKFKHNSKVIDRKRPLLAKGIIPQKEFDEAHREYSLAETEVKGVQLELDKLKREMLEVQQRLKTSSYYSPMDGTVSGLIAMEGGSPEAQPGQLLAVVSDPRNLALWVAVEEGSIHRINVGTTIYVTLDTTGEKNFEGKVLNVGSSSTSGASAQRSIATQMKTYEVSVGFTAPNQVIREGYSGTATLYYARKPDTLAIPAAAVRYNEGKDFVVAASSATGSGEPRGIQIGLRTENEVEVLSGLTENEYVIVETK